MIKGHPQKIDKSSIVLTRPDAMSVIEGAGCGMISPVPMVPTTTARLMVNEVHQKARHEIGGVRRLRYPLEGVSLP